MSWLGDFSNGSQVKPDGTRPKIGEDDDSPLVQDASGRMVSSRTSNQPYLQYASILMV